MNPAAPAPAAEAGAATDGEAPGMIMEWLADRALRQAERKQAEAEAAMRAGNVEKAKRLLSESVLRSKYAATLRPDAGAAAFADFRDAVAEATAETRRRVDATQRRLDALKARQSEIKQRGRVA